jgi:hypothetical protein
MYLDDVTTLSTRVDVDNTLLAQSLDIIRDDADIEGVRSVLECSRMLVRVHYVPNDTRESREKTE